MGKMFEYVESHGAKKLNGCISATYAVVDDVMDIEVGMPIDNEIPSTDEYIFKPVFSLVNCAKVSHNDSALHLQETIGKINKFVLEQALKPSTACFIVIHNEMTEPNDVMNADIYIPINISST